MRQAKAFTLVELLVVISIIALLLSILMPSLNKARTQARILTCAANAKQVMTIVGVYQAENNGCVPVILTRYCSDSSLNIPAKNCYLSVAFRDYDQKTKGKLIKAPLNADKPWDVSGGAYLRYCKEYLPDYYKCPFSRGKAAGITKSIGTRKINDATVDLFENKGSEDSFATFLWPYKGGKECYIVNTPYIRNGGYDKIYPKYGAQSWHGYFKWYSEWGNPARQFSKIKDRPMRWDSADFRAVGASGPSGVTVLFCAVGEYAASPYSGQYSTYNYGSHKKGSGGGTEGVFADGHVEWVKGTQIGWP